MAPDSCRISAILDPPWRQFRESDQGCQMVYFQTKNPNLGKFFRALDWKMLICFMAIWNILRTCGIAYDHLVQFLFNGQIFSSFEIVHQEKSGNPESNSARIYGKKF
jgi:hypothetical protein